MSVLSGKKILLGITGGIAAYKTAALVRLLIKAGAEIQVIMTPASHQFVTPFTLSTLSKKPVYTKFFNAGDEGGTWNNHVDLALWADFIIIAPATANTLAKMANGICDNLLMAIYLSAKCPVFVAPAMDLDMYVHPSTDRNINLLTSYGNIIIPAEEGELASGLVGKGRMAEPEHILDFIDDYFNTSLPLKGKKILITAGPTYEPIDPVRFIGNHSSGKMGFDIAMEAAKRGAEVVLVSGPTNQKISHPLVKVISILSAKEMYTVCHDYFESVDAVVAAAAVADYRPKHVADQKIKKNSEEFVIEMDKNPDILASLGAIKKKQFLIGFALETQNEVEHAKQKIVKKNLDLIVLNSLNDKGAGFGKPTNKVTFIDKDFNLEPMELKLKEEVAIDIVQKIIDHYA
ncbi:bifunctional phosphopantothenoylcysteine decarboxylase/phosphopantothenate--cysteine ligase CoaBC [Myroides phaeus]|uniref:bifunctional phosphopantothenoylcysteine decarboxylase/phosphopantothenate--cysteine ligase CoaBC n=1 Tax=Myroides phaeus TaxID=702745 RepID=UPI002DB8FEDA|nr:bifunctional phosphopantothenoylcysteine decarboxylase/phosphopantothenate--cysteine ligase CoaBC [Myroides phaeus]MEC4116914.1 bifunctional phosphopantothenoylcysteine decarboxylase/phosphopantothenate--cysteine ligase CoaBC [Myroides phaeus]